MFETVLVAFYRRSMSIMPKIIEPRGICMPGLRKIFVDPQGNFGVCEKIPRSFIIGNFYDGFNFNAIFQLIIDYSKFRESECLTCWAYRICTACFVFCKDDNTWNKERMKKICNNRKNKILHNLANYCMLQEKKPNVFDFVNEEYELI